MWVLVSPPLFGQAS